VTSILNRFGVSHRLLLISATFTLPLGVTVFLVVTTINDNIRFSQLELYGNEIQRPLEAMLEGLTAHRQAALGLAAGDQSQSAPAAASARAVDEAFAQLQHAAARVGNDLQITPEGLHQRKRDHVALATVRAEWKGLANAASQATTLDEQHTHLISDVRTMIAHAGDTSNLILDPDLDSYYTMDATLVALPQTQERISNIVAFAQGLASRGKATEEERVQLAIMAALLKESDIARVQADAEVALNEDANFQGVSATLQQNLRPAVDRYATAAGAAADALVSASRGGTDFAAIVRTGAAAREQSFAAWKTAAGELDGLLTARLDRHHSSRFWALALSALVWLAAQAVVVVIARSISRPLQAASEELGSYAGEITAAADQVAASAQTLSQGSTQQAAALEETSASMEEMASVTRGNADRSHEAARLMGDVDVRVKDSNQALEEMVSSMASIQESSQQVSRIIKTIDEIAFQTNILALNAAVEAARAGEAGMGFAVVADEVRSLAQRSAQAARDTARLIEASLEKAQSGNTRVEQVAGAIAGITESVEKVKSLVEQVSVASREQAQGIDQVSQAVAQMEKLTQKTAATAEESAAASEELSAQAEASKMSATSLRSLVTGTRTVATREAHVARPSSRNVLAGLRRAS
jgi:methyl-accepting chemotaxis protein